MQEALLKNMAHMTYGIYVLTTRFERTVNGMIASWVSQVSFAPPLFMAAVHPNRYSHELLTKSGHFALHILSRAQKDLLARFKGPVAAEKFASIAWSDGVTGCPILTECVGCLECRIVQRLAPGNHTLFLGEVVNAVFNGDKIPLCTLDYDGCYLGKA
jgi:flavin reductase (DIM6/NTAB) family NADH-FMN oxidoreductase RutF